MNCVSEINEYGDIRCPDCGLWIIAPAGCGYQAGTGLCKLCGHLFSLTAETAQKANDKLDSIFTAEHPTSLKLCRAGS